jgi:hypothetical protein
LELSKKLKPRKRLRKRGVGEKRKLRRQQRRSERGKLLSAPRLRPQPTRNVETKRGLRGRRRERGKNKRGNWPPKGKKKGNHNRAYSPFVVTLKSEVLR